MSRTMIAAALGLVCVGACIAPQAFAKEETCRAEMDKFCKDVQPGEGRLVKCLREHDADLSAKCRAYVNTAVQYMACLDDATRLCPRMEPAGGRVLQCLRTHQTDLSTECKNELRRMRR